MEDLENESLQWTGQVILKLTFKNILIIWLASCPNYLLIEQIPTLYQREKNIGHKYIDIFSL